MKREEYIETLIIKDIEIDVGIDDYGQCYFFEYIDGNGNKRKIGCGSYNPNYKEEIAGYFGVNEEDIKLINEKRC